jgi:transcriptional regulator with GAF, ATPase, and Fis domain
MTSINDVSWIRELVGENPGLRAVLQEVARVAPTDSTVLIQGETGTGKELIAQAIHRGSRRGSGPFVKLNSAALPPTMIESELFGHERGAFTGAATRRVGRFELANQGTLFLDEIGELDLQLQPKLLRVLQDGEFERLGGETAIRTNARLVAATHRDLGAMTRAGAFRLDLFYRLNVFPIRLPPLRERRDDIPALAEYFVRLLSRRLGRGAPRLSARLLQRLCEHDWPGNVRELQNVLERALILCPGPQLEPESCVIMTASRTGEPLNDVVRAHIVTVLDATNWVVAGPNGAAARLRMKRSTLAFRMKKLGIVRGSEKQPA